MRALHRDIVELCRARMLWRAGVVVTLLASVAGCVISREATKPVAIVVSDRLPAYQQVAEAIAARLGSTHRYDLDGDARRVAGVAARLQEQRAHVIAIGPLARTVGLPGGAVIVCQDFAADDCRGTGVRAVRATPPAAKQLQAWRLLDARLRRVALVRGVSGAAFARDARAAAQPLKLQLDDIEVGSDRELLYAVKNLDADVQGVWFIPDGRVLSTGVLREALAHALRQGKQALVFSPELLGFGALLSAEADPEDIAARAIEQLRAGEEAPRIVPLQRVRVQINKEVARQLGITVPAAMQAGVYVF